MKIFTVWLIIAFCSAASAESISVEKVKAWRENDTFVAELALASDIKMSEVNVEFFNEVIQLDFAKSSLPKGKSLIKVEDPSVRSVFVYSPEKDKVRMRVILKQELAARIFENSMQFVRGDRSLKLRITGAGESSAGAQANLDNLEVARVYPILAAASDVSPVDDILTQTRLVAQGEETQKSAPRVDAAAAAVELAEADQIVVDPLKTAKESEIPVLTEETKNKKESSNPLRRGLVTLGILTVLLGAASFGLRKWMQKSRSRNSSTTQIKVLTQHHLGPKKSLAIVRVAGESILIGVTDQNISMLKTLSLLDEDIPEDTPRNFDRAMEDYDEDGNGAEAEEFAFKGIGEIRDSVSKRLKSMRQI